MWNCETNKEENTSSTSDNEDKKKGKTLNAREGETMNACYGYFNIYECSKNICQSKYEQSCIALDYIKEVSMNLETRYQNLSPLVTQ